MKKIVHLETVVRAVFGVLDEEGDIIEKAPITIEIPKLNTETATNLLKVIADTKQKMQEKVDEGQPPVLEQIN